jgi:hypothetical protein
LRSSRFVVADLSVLEVQKRKRQMISDAFNEKKKQSAQEARLGELQLLLSARTVVVIDP